MSDTIEVNGITYDADEVNERTLVIHGQQPTDFEQWEYIEVLAQLRNKKTNAGGRAQAGYRYADLSDYTKFNEHQYPYKADVKTITTVDKKGNQITEIIWVDFANVEEMVTIPRKEYERLTATGSQKSIAQQTQAKA